MNLVRLLEESAAKFSWRNFIVSAGGCLSFAALNKKADQLSFGLREKLGIKRGERVAVLLKNCPEFIIAFFAILKAGAICVPLNIFLTASELKFILQDSRAKLLISSAEFLQILKELAVENVVLTDQQSDNFYYWPELMADNQISHPAVDISPEDLAVLIYTSGTTGNPKGVMLSHSNLCSNVISSVQALEIMPKDRFLLILPMFHSFTLTVCILIPLYVGAKTIIIKSIRPFQRVLRGVLLNRVTIIVGIPPLFDILKGLNLHPLLQRFLPVRVCISGAAPLSTETLTKFKAAFKKITLLEGYGLTEASPVVSINPLRGEQKIGSIGLPIPGVEVKVVRDDESEADSGEIGELIVKGPNVMMGYLNQPEQSKQTIKMGWLFTGDMARIDSDGYIYIVGRKKEMILVRGMNVYPQEIENVLISHPKVKEAAVVGKKDKVKGEAALAFIVLKEGESAQDQEIIGYCRGKLANYKIPRLIEFRKDLPKTPTGKVLKRKLV